MKICSQVVVSTGLMTLRAVIGTLCLSKILKIGVSTEIFLVIFSIFIDLEQFDWIHFGFFHSSWKFSCQASERNAIRIWAQESSCQWRKKIKKDLISFYLIKNLKKKNINEKITEKKFLILTSIKKKFWLIA